jgi:uncharacterized protein YprB with RNaseH-like and TPR domain
MAPVENLLKKQLAQIKARALMIAGRAGADAIPSNASPDDAFRPSGKEPVSPASPSTPAAASSPSGTANEIIESVLRTGAVVRGSNAHLLARLRRGPWWWRRRAGGAFANREGFEAEFRQMLAGMATGEPVSIEAAVPGRVRVLDGAGYYLIRYAGADVDTGAVAEAERFSRLSRWPEAVSRTVVAPRRTPEHLMRLITETGPTPGGILFLDIETAGLSANTYAFLCGLMYLRDGDFHVEQVFARDYTEEEGMLRHVRETLSRFDTVVTYNGASFDLPFIRTRMAVHRIPDVKPVGSVDLLHSSRRVFREILPNCRLVTVERHLRGVDRVDDIPSRFIPRAYHEYVRTKDARIMRNVVYHNRMDLFTMAVILNHLGEAGFPVVTVAGQPRESVGELPHAEGEKAFAPPPGGATIPGPYPPHVPF